MPLVYPVTTEALPAPLSYEQVISDFYDAASVDVAAHLDAGRDVAVICEGDPFFYGSYMYLHDRLAERYDAQVIPGVCSMLGGASVLGAPLVYRNQSLSVLSGVLPHDELKRRLADADAAVIMKLGRNFTKVRQVLEELGLAGRALYVERATMANQKIVALDQVEPMVMTPAIVILGQGSLATARSIQQVYPGALIHGLAGRVEGADQAYSEFGATVRQLYQQGTPIIALCAAGIVIRTLAALLLEKGEEPAVLAVAEDGSAVVPLLGGLGGVNIMAREIAAALGVAAAITTSGELRFGTCLLNPPQGYQLADLELGKRFVSDLLAGEQVRIEGAAPWLEQANLPQDQQARLSIHVGSAERVPAANELLIYPKNTWVTCRPGVGLAARVRQALQQDGIAVQSLACLLADDADMASGELHEAALELGVPLRFTALAAGPDIVIHSAAGPVELAQLGRPRGRLAVIGLGPGAAELMVPAVKAELARCTDVLGYETYVRMAGPFRADQ
eukprot:gene20060-19964_t